MNCEHSVQIYCRVRMSTNQKYGTIFIHLFIIILEMIFLIQLRVKCVMTPKCVCLSLFLSVLLLLLL